MGSFCPRTTTRYSRNALNIFPPPFIGRNFTINYPQKILWTVQSDQHHHQEQQLMPSHCDIARIQNDSVGSGVAQLVERLLPIPEVRGSNPVIGKKLYRTLTVNCIVKTKIKKFFLKRENIFFSDYSLQLCRGSHHRSSRFDR